MKSFIQHGDIWDYANASGSTIPAGTGVVINTVVGVAVSDIPNGAVGAVRVKGVVAFANPTAEVVAQGVALNFDATAQEMQLAAGDLANAGVAVTAAGSGVTVVWVSLNPATA